MRIIAKLFCQLRPFHLNSQPVGNADTKYKKTSILFFICWQICMCPIFKNSEENMLDLTELKVECAFYLVLGPFRA